MKDKNGKSEESKKVSEIGIVCKKCDYGNKSVGTSSGKV